MKYALIILFLAATLMAQHDDEAEKKEIIERILITEGYRAASAAFFERQVEESKEEFKDVPESVWDEVRANLDDTGAFAEGVVEIYLARFSMDELIEIERALDNPAMKKWREYLESEDSGQDFGLMAAEAGSQINRDIRNYLLERDYVER
jgi:hypothetical protein